MIPYNLFLAIFAWESDSDSYPIAKQELANMNYDNLIKELCYKKFSGVGKQ
jgi:hypothetical protein